MKNINTNTILQIVALLFLVIIGYMTFSSGSKWDIIEAQLKEAKEQLTESKKTLTTTIANLETSKSELQKIQLQKDIFKRQRDSLLLDFERKNAVDWNSLEAIKDSITINNEELIMYKKILDSLRGKK